MSDDTTKQGQSQASGAPRKFVSTDTAALGQEPHFGSVDILEQFCDDPKCWCQPPARAATGPAGLSKVALERLQDDIEMESDAYQRGVEAERAHGDEMLELLRECVNGLNCQPGYVRSQTIIRMQQVIAKAEAIRSGKGGQASE